MEAKEVKAIELLDFDFSKYETVSINGVTIFDLEVIEKKDSSMDAVAVDGKRGEELIVGINFFDDDQLRIVELSESHISIRKIEKVCEYQ